MAFLFADGFQGYAAVADMSREYVVTTPAGLSIVAGRSGGTTKALRSTNNNSTLSKTVGPINHVFFGTAIRLDSAPTADLDILSVFEDTRVQAFLRLKPSGLLEAHSTRIANQPSLMSVGTVPVSGLFWHYLETEFFVNPTSGFMRVRLDNVTIIETEIQRVMNSASVNPWLDRVLVRQGSGNNISDLYIFDGQGDVNSSFFGDCQIDESVVVANGSRNEWTVVGAASASAAVSDASDATAVESAVQGQRQMFQFADLPGDVGRLAAVRVRYRAAKSVAGDRNISVVAAFPDGDVVSPSLFVPTQIADGSYVFEKNASGEPLTKSLVNSSEFGIETT